ncbi:unnamed protein product [Heterotrigona itama]|uniref:Uncharacterized protein n=1 Tax=Heterotrigona itama TaxID=395501 RepID=A0A6V7H549_9HYME|nr:unnamed protein product [Heterotrigona itama]
MVNITLCMHPTSKKCQQSFGNRYTAYFVVMAEADAPVAISVPAIRRENDCFLLLATPINRYHLFLTLRLKSFIPMDSVSLVMKSRIPRETNSSPLSSFEDDSELQEFW